MIINFIYTNRFTSFSSFSSSGGGGGNSGVVKSTSKSTKVVNGKKYVTTK